MTSYKLRSQICCLIPIKAAPADRKKVVKVFAFIGFQKVVGMAMMVGVAVMVRVAVVVAVAAAAVAGSLFSFFSMKNDSKAENGKGKKGEREI